MLHRLPDSRLVADVNDLADDLENRTAGFHVPGRGGDDEGQGAVLNPGRAPREGAVHESHPARFALPGDALLVFPVDRGHADHHGVFSRSLENPVRPGDHLQNLGVIQH